LYSAKTTHFKGFWKINPKNLTTPGQVKKFINWVKFGMISTGRKCLFLTVPVGKKIHSASNTTFPAFSPPYKGGVRGRFSVPPDTPEHTEENG
jgi:hypothetical protein